MNKRTQAALEALRAAFPSSWEIIHEYVQAVVEDEADDLRDQINGTGMHDPNY